MFFTSCAGICKLFSSLLLSTSVVSTLQCGVLTTGSQIMMGAMLPQTQRSDWQVAFSNDWNVLGPFPIHAREQHFLSPSFPLNLSETIDFGRKWTSAYADGGEVGWRTAQSHNGTLHLSYPDIRWASLRATEGWAALQHHSVLRTTVTIYPPSSQRDSREPPNLSIDIQQGSFFAIRPSETSDYDIKSFTPRWYAGNIYEMDAAPPHTVPLPMPPSVTQPTVYELFVSGDYEIRLFGDPTVAGSDVPTLSLTIDVQLEDPRPHVSVLRSHNVIPDFIEGWAFGKILGVGIRSSAGWWTVEDVEFVNSDASSLSLDVLERLRIGPGQTRVIPLVINQIDIFTEGSIELDITVSSLDGANVKLPVSLKLNHVLQWDNVLYKPLVSSYLYAGSTPTAFASIPPKTISQDMHSPPLLILHGAGVNVLTNPFWGCSPLRQEHSWIVMPTGRTAWGLDWHGPSTEDAWASVTALSDILSHNSKWSSWGFPKQSQVILMGHSNGGQGAWHVAARHPDAVLAAIPAAAYIKSQAYISLVQSRSAHFIDPFLRAILETSLTPDDNDLFVTNLVNTPILAIHGGSDENVPVWHTRALVDTLKAWNIGANVTFKEDPGESHCYRTVFENEQVQSFIDEAIRQQDTLSGQLSQSFTLTVAVPSESGSLHGFRVLKLRTPGRLARLTVKTDLKGVHISPNNIAAFALDIKAVENLQTSELIVNGQVVKLSQGHHDQIISQDSRDGWKVETDPLSFHVQPSGRMSKILSSSGPLSIVVPHISDTNVQAALRIAHDLDVYHKLSAEILTASEALTRLDSGCLGTGNMVTIGGLDNAFTRRILHASPTPFELLGDSLAFRGHILAKGVSSIFLHPHPTSASSLILVMYSLDEEGLERLMRLFPIRTGITAPDWMILGRNTDRFGAAGVEGAGVWGDQWSWNEGLSFF